MDGTRGKNRRGSGTRTGLGAVAVACAALALLASGCGTQHAGDAASPGATVEPAGRVPGPSGSSGTVDFPCPGESAVPSSAPPPTVPTTGPNGALRDHYAENNAFRMPIPLHGQRRCAGLAATARIEGALQPLIERADFVPEHTADALSALGYEPSAVRAEGMGRDTVAFHIDARPLCLEGTMGPGRVSTDAFGGYPDGTGCERPKSGH